MKNYGYVARDLAGVQKKGVAQAANSNEVLNQLREQGLTPISVKEATQKGAPKVRHKGRRKSIKSADLAALCWQLSTMLEGGIPITTALDIIGEDTDNAQLQNILKQISEKVRKGQPVSECVAEYPKVFNRLSCAMILAGETGGNIAKAIGKLAEYFENRDKLAKKVKGAMAYPLFVLTFIVIIVIFIMAFIVPRFRKIFDQIGGTLPAFTRGFMGFYDFLHYNLLYIIGFVIVTIVLASLFSKTKKGHLLFSKLSLTIPLFGKILSQAFVATFCRTTSTLLASGVSVLEAFNILTGMTDNDIIKTAITQTRENIVGGSNISLSMSSAGFFPNMVIKMIQVGEESGSMPEVLEKTSEHYERKVDTTVTTLLSLLEPIMIISVGAIVSVVVIALYLPIFTMSDM
ncbi:MAG: type II secretion system F family protein [Sedimentisphaerales bacterium]|nr:type II secretion system F family protein [Sedimentisphaerales bacterium]